jgi:hypothetical protein
VTDDGHEVFEEGEMSLKEIGKVLLIAYAKFVRLVTVTALHKLAAKLDTPRVSPPRRWSAGVPGSMMRKQWEMESFLDNLSKEKKE